MRTTLPLAVVAALAVSVTAGCAIHPYQEAPTPTPTASVQAAQAGGAPHQPPTHAPTPTTPPEPDGVAAQDPPDEAAKAIAGYEQAIANSDATSQSSPDAWISQVAPYTTIDYSTYTQPADMERKAWAEAHTGGRDYQADVTVIGCYTLPTQAPQDTHLSATCTTSTQVTDSSGNPISLETLTPAWQSVAGARTTVYDLVNDSGTWKVAQAHLPDTENYPR